jgi:hypothetical protein
MRPAPHSFQFTDQNLTDTSVLIRMRPTRWLSTDYTKEG